MSTGVKFFQLPPHTIGTLAPLIEKRLEPVLRRMGGRWTPAALIDDIASGRSQCWTAWEGNECLAAVVTSIKTHSSGMKTLSAMIASGDHREKWQYIAVDHLVDFMKAEGCERFEIHARPGWERVLSPKGFKRTHIVLELEVNPNG